MRASTSWQLSDGRSCLFWMDHWVFGRCISKLAPLIFAMVPRRRRKSRTIQEGLQLQSWVQDIQGALGPATMVQYVELWHLLHHTHLSDIPDKLVWRWTESGVYTAASCYSAMFIGSLPDPHWRLTWKTWVPLNTKIFLWLSAQDRCWTTKRLARHGLPHADYCLLCNQEPESMQHLLVGCSFSR